jgi:methionyl-tRNA formyltransferase
VRIAFLGSPPFASPILERLCASRHAPVIVLTQPDRARGRGQKVQASAIADLARARGIELLQPERAGAPEVLERLAAARPEALLVASYGELLGRELLELAPRGAWNVHASLLPRHRGASPVQRAILEGDAQTGVCVQRMVLELDAGDVLCEQRTPIEPDETAGELAARLAALGAELAVRALDSIESGDARPVPQDPARVTRCKKIKKGDGAIDWTRGADELVRLVRAMNPWPLARACTPAGEALALLRARALPGSAAPAPSGPPGGVLEAGPRLLVACGSGVLELLEVQLAGRRALPAPEFLRGNALRPGERLRAGA